MMSTTLKLLGNFGVEIQTVADAVSEKGVFALPARTLSDHYIGTGHSLVLESVAFRRLVLAHSGAFVWAVEDIAFLRLPAKLVRISDLAGGWSASWHTKSRHEAEYPKRPSPACNLRFCASFHCLGDRRP